MNFFIYKNQKKYEMGLLSISQNDRFMAWNPSSIIPLSFYNKQLDKKIKKVVDNCFIVLYYI